MELSAPEIYYRALEGKDARFDGLVFVGVKSTGIYCRPVCPARTPKFQNCTFYSSAAAAQDAGYRPCLRCRPETAPGLAPWRGTSTTVTRAIDLIEDGALDGERASVDALATRLGVGERQLRRLFLQHLGASPISVAQTRRVLFAKQLLHDTSMPIADVALASGFNSVRRFNEVFQHVFHWPPSAMRRKLHSQAGAEEAVSLRLRYKPPYDWEAMLHFLRARAITGVEVVTEDRYFRTVHVDRETGSIEVSHDRKRESLNVSIRFPSVSAYPAIVSRVRRLFDLSADITKIDAHLALDPMLAALVARRPGLRAPGCWDGFELAVRAVLGQQISVSAARKLAGQLVHLHGSAVSASHAARAGLTRVFPTAAQLTRATSIGLGMPAARLATLSALAQASVADADLFQPLGSTDETVKRLKSIRGIGEWTAQYIALRATRAMDAFPATDVVLLRAVAALDPTVDSADQLLQRAEQWRPWRAYAAQHLWASATQNATREESLA